jgi:hypothetical protein
MNEATRHMGAKTDRREIANPRHADGDEEIGTGSVCIDYF